MKVLFVCTGNTCRSPMAEGIFNTLARQYSMQGRLQAFSAGLYAYEGNSASKNAIAVCKANGIDISGHRTVPFDYFSTDDVDLIVPMTGGQLSDIINANPKNADKTILLSAWGFDDDSLNVDIEDPFGGGLEEYQAAFERLSYFVGSAFERLKRQIEASG